MVTKGIIRKIQNNNTYSVWVPFFDDPSEDATETILSATLSEASGINGGYSIGDVVYCAFEDNTTSRVVIIGKLSGSEVENTGGKINSEFLNVAKKAVLPVDTMIGSTKMKDVLNNIINLGTNSGNSTSGIEVLKISLTYSSSSDEYQVDKTFSQIADAYSAGNFIYLEDFTGLITSGTLGIPLTSYAQNLYFKFETLVEDTLHVFRIDESDTVEWNYLTFVLPTGDITGNAATATYATSGGSALTANSATTSTNATNAVNVTTASKLGSATKGGANTPIYLDNGSPEVGNEYVPKTGGAYSGNVTSTGSIVGARNILWEGTVQGGNDITLDVSGYTQIRVWFHTYAITFPVDVDLTIVPNHDVSTSYTGWYSSSNSASYYENRAETYYGVVLVNPAKTTVRIHYIAFYYGTSYNARNNNADYFVYRIEGLRK